MNCENCGSDVVVGTKFCEECGVEVRKRFSENILFCNDGIYRWTYEMNMWKNPTLLITVWKVFFICGMFPVLLMTILELFEQGLKEALQVFVPVFLIVTGIMTGLIIIAYPIVALMDGGKYQVVFELSDVGINHIQVEKQFKKNQVFAWITAMTGAAAGNLQATGGGLLAATKSNSYCEFKHVKKIVAKSSRHVIYINESLEHNQIYVAKDDFEEVLNYFVERSTKAVVKKS